MCSILGNIMVKATSRTVHHEFKKYLDMAHAGQSVVITKRGKPWATLKPVRMAKPKPKKKLDWGRVFRETEKIYGGKKLKVIESMLREREIDPRA
jgi:prevent-host-death family protein